MEKKNSRIEIRLSDSIMAKLKALCSAEGRTMTAQIEEMIKNEWKNLKKSLKFVRQRDSQILSQKVTNFVKNWQKIEKIGSFVRILCGFYVKTSLFY